ncbi:hypothetical protein ALMP_75920 [Streptomyces sp. A012304]|nr:hypothetical protein ALMP_75920 [Streptomyces sp. A012304]
MSEGYEGNTGGAGGTGPTRRARSIGGTGTAFGRAGIPFRAHVFRVSAFLRDRLHARRAAPNGRIRHA